MTNQKTQCQNCDKIGGDMLRYWHNDEWFDFCNCDCAEEWARTVGLIVDNGNRRLYDSVFDVCDDAEDYGEEL